VQIGLLNADMSNIQLGVGPGSQNSQQVEWGDSAQARCWIPYQLPARSDNAAAYVAIDGVCHANGNPKTGIREQ